MVGYMHEEIYEDDVNRTSTIFEAFRFKLEKYVALYDDPKADKEEINEKLIFLSDFMEDLHANGLLNDWAYNKLVKLFIIFEQKDLQK